MEGGERVPPLVRQFSPTIFVGGCIQILDKFDICARYNV